MQCPYCGSWQTRIIDSRMVGDRRRRRYECYDCKERFSTYEYGKKVADKIEDIMKRNEERKLTFEKIIELARAGRR